jgi:ATP-dependent DNA helicase RecQ
VLGFLEKRRGQSGIIYCGKRKQADELSAGLNANGWPALPYHAGLEDDLRRRNQEQFTHGEAIVMVATVAFGMGINKPDVRFVIHVHLPKDVEGYYQEIGRAGRDNLPALCLLLHSYADVMVHRHFIEEGAVSERPGRYARLKALLRLVETRDCRRKPLLAYFGEALDQPCGACDRCVGSSPQTGAAPAIPIIRPILRRRFHEVGELFVAGQTIEHIAKRFGILRSTVIENLHRFQEAGGKLDPQRVLGLSRLPDSLQARVLDAFERVGVEQLAPAHKALSGTVAYDELHVLRLYALCRTRE